MGPWELPDNPQGPSERKTPGKVPGIPLLRGRFMLQVLDVTFGGKDTLVE